MTTRSGISLDTGVISSSRVFAAQESLITSRVRSVVLVETGRSARIVSDIPRLQSSRVEILVIARRLIRIILTV